jgi:uncharacterized protein
MKTEFYYLIKDIISTDEYQSMKNIKHHKYTNAYMHSIRVAYLCYLHYLKHPDKCDLNTLLRGALLHDYYLYDWHDKGNPKLRHCFVHPRRSYKNAIRDYKNINKKEKDMILHHMWPVTIIPPHTRYGWLIVRMDKKAAAHDYAIKRRNKKRKKMMLKLQKRNKAIA